MAGYLLQLVFGIFLLLTSTKQLISQSRQIAAAARLSPLFIGITVVALGTSLPELAVSTIAVVRNDLGLAMGNIVGSNIINILLVLPVGIFMGKLRIGTTKTQRTILILLGVTALFIAVRVVAVSHVIIGAFFITLSLALTALEYFWARSGSKHEDKANLKKSKKESISAITIILLPLSVLGIIIGGYLTVASTESIALLTGYSTTTLGLSLTAIVTSLPELLTTIFSQSDHQEKITIGNIIGSNIYNLLFIGGFVYLFSANLHIRYDELALLGGTTVLMSLVLWFYRGRAVPRPIGILFLILLSGYFWFLGTAR